MSAAPSALRWWSRWAGCCSGAHSARPLDEPSPPARRKPVPTSTRDRAANDTMWRWLSKGKPRAARSNAAAQPGGLANYRIERLMGKGAASQVFLAQDRRSGLWVALKVLELGSGLASPESHDALERFRREATVLHGLDHPGIVAVLDAGPSERGAWMAMEAVAGCDLTRYTRPSRLLPPPLVARIGARVAEALAYAHRRGVVHRDVKPANVLVDWTTDSGQAERFRSRAQRRAHADPLGHHARLARLHGTRAAGGRRASMRAATSTRLGVTAVRAAGRPRPHQADNLGALLRAVASEPRTAVARLRPELAHGAVPNAVWRCCAEDTAQRPSRRRRVAATLCERARHWPERSASAATPVESGDRGPPGPAGSEAQSAGYNATSACPRPPPAAMTLEFFRATDTGRARNNNEDSVAWTKPQRAGRAGRRHGRLQRRRGGQRHGHLVHQDRARALAGTRPRSQRHRHRSAPGDGHLRRQRQPRDLQRRQLQPAVRRHGHDAGGGGVPRNRAAARPRRRFARLPPARPGA